MDKHCNKITLNSPSLQNLFRYNQSVDGQTLYKITLSSSSLQNLFRYNQSVDGQTERQGDDKNNLKSQFKVKLIKIRNFVE